MFFLVFSLITFATPLPGCGEYLVRGKLLNENGLYFIHTLIGSPSEEVFSLAGVSTQNAMFSGTILTPASISVEIRANFFGETRDALNQRMQHLEVISLQSVYAFNESVESLNRFECRVTKAKTKGAREPAKKL